MPIHPETARRILLFLVSIEILFALMFLADFWIPEPNYIHAYLANVDDEHNIPAYFSGLQLLSVGILLLYIAVVLAVQRQFSPWVFLILGVLFVFLATDEVFGIHEQIQMKYRRGKMGEFANFIPRIKKHYGVWMSLYLFAGAVLALLLFRPLLKFWRAAPWPATIMGIGFGFFLLGAVGMESVAYLYLWGSDTEALLGYLHKPIYSFVLMAEEFFEMFGVSIVLYGVLLISPQTLVMDHPSERYRALILLSKVVTMAMIVVGCVVLLVALLSDLLLGLSYDLSGAQRIAIAAGVLLAGSGFFLRKLYLPKWLD